MTTHIATIEEIHERFLKMMKVITSILEKHNIPYSMAYGTLLGAIRHHGFIPWDEDVDFWLFADTYDEAIEVLRSELPKDMFLEDEKSEPLFFHGWAHIKDLNSIVECSAYSQDNSYFHKGLSIDIYKLERIKEQELKHYLNSENRRYITRRKEMGLITEEEFQKRMSKLEQDEIDAKTESCKSEEEIFALVIFYDCKKLYPSYFFPLVKYPFEDTAFYGVNQADKVLTDIYGDYMTPLPKNKRLKTHKSVLFID